MGENEFQFESHVPRNFAAALGARLRLLRLHGQLTVRELSVRSGVSEGAINAIEKGAGTRGPRIDTLLQLAGVLGLASIEELLGSELGTQRLRRRARLERQSQA